MVQDEFSTFWSDDGKRSSTIIRLEDMFKVIFEDRVSNFNMFLYHKTIESAEKAAKSYVMYESY